MITPSRRSMLGFLIAAPAVIRVATLMPIKVYKEVEPYMPTTGERYDLRYIERGYTEVRAKLVRYGLPSYAREELVSTDITGIIEERSCNGFSLHPDDVGPSVKEELNVRLLSDRKGQMSIPEPGKTVTVNGQEYMVEQINIDREPTILYGHYGVEKMWHEPFQT